MPHNLLKDGSVQEPLALLYRNGDAVTSDNIVFPRYSDISLTRDSQANCDLAIEEAKHFDRPIRSVGECQQYIELHRIVDDVIKNLKNLAKTDREPFVKILDQISTAIEPAQTKLIAISAALRKRITDWRDMEIDGERREKERLEREAEEKRQEAKYTDDPRKKRQAKVAAKQLEKAAKEAAPKPEKGMATEEYWVATINNRALAAKLSVDLVKMEIDETRLNQEIKRRQQAGEKITPNIFPGLTIERKTRVRLYR